MIEKIKIGLDENESSALRKDAESFGFGKNDGSLNIGAFLNQLLPSLYKERQKKKEDIASILADRFGKRSFNDNLVSTMSKQLDSIGYRRAYVTLGKSVLSSPLAFRPNKNNMSIFEEMEENETLETTLSNFLRQMIQDYLRYPKGDREAILFCDATNKIQEAFAHDRRLRFLYKGQSFAMRPFSFLQDENRQCSYLYGDVSVKEGEIEPASFPLRDIAESIFFAPGVSEFTPKEEKTLQASLILGIENYIPKNI